MALKRATKSLPLSGGIVEEVDDFLLEPAGMQYMENLRFTKKDAAEKAEPTSLIASTGGANHTVDAYGIWTRGDDVSIVENNNVLVSLDAGVTWDQISQDTDLLGIEKILSTAEANGGMNFTCAPIGNFTAAPRSFVPSLYGVAYERLRQDTATLDNFRDVVVATYELDGRLITEKVIENHCTPRMMWDDSGATLMMVDTTNGDLRIESASEASRAFQFSSTTAHDIRLFNQHYNTTNDGWGAPASELLGEDMRLGHSVDYRYNNAALTMFTDIESSAGVAAWKSQGTIEWTELLNGGPTGTLQLILGDVPPTYNSVLDCTTDGTDAYLLIARTDTSAALGGTSLWIYSEPLGGGTITAWQFRTGLTGQFVNGSLRLDTSGDLFVAATFASGHPDDLQITTQGSHRVEWFQLNDPLTTQTIPFSGELFSHRLISNLVVDKNGLPHFVVQQWDNYNPEAIPTIGASPDIPALTTAHKKPTTSILIDLEFSTGVAQVQATFDAGQSKAMPPGMEEQNIHIMNLYYFDQGIGTAGAHQFWFGNNNILTAEDDFYYISKDTANAWALNDGRIPLVPGAARLNLYRLQSSIRVPYVTFPDGLFMGTSCPSWYDGSRELSSITAIESPEIVSADMDGDGGTYTAYQDLGLGNDLPIVIQAVAGYYDDAGLVHRSAPSVPLYVGNAQASVTTALWTRAWVTPPLTLSKDHSHFIEIYESLPGGVPTLAATRQLTSGNADAKVTLRWATNVNPTTINHDIGVTEFRGSKAIYTAGNVLAADPWPNFDIVIKSGRRLFAHSIADESAVFYSKTFENGVSPEFSASLVVSLGNETISAMGSVDDKVILWTRDSMWMMYGTGPDNTGANGDFFVEKLPFQTGCIDQESVLSYDDGIAFYSNTTREFHTITRDLQLIDLGENVKVMTEGSAFDVKRGLVYPEAHELRWYCSQTPGPEYITDSATNSPPQPPRPFLENQTPTSPVFVFNYKYNKWSILDDGSPDFHIVGLLDGKPCGLKNWIFYSTTETWTDSNLAKWETPWIKVNQLQDYGRFYGATFLGKYLSSWSDTGSGVESGDLQVTVKYDYEGPLGSTDVYRFRANRDFDPAGGDRFQFELNGLSRQKCQAVKFQIEEIATSAVEVWEPTYARGRGISLVAVDLLYGAKGGSSRTFSQKRVK